MPNRQDVERCVVACLMLYGAPLFDEPALAVTDFADLAHRRIYLAIRDGIPLEGDELDRGLAACECLPGLAAFSDYVEALHAFSRP